MEKSYKNILRRSRQRIVDDLDVTDVLDRLLGEEVVGEEQMKTIIMIIIVGGQRGADGGDLVQTCKGGQGSLLVGCSRQERWTSLIFGTFSSHRESSFRSESLCHISRLPEGELQLAGRPDDGKPFCGWRTEDHGNILRE